MGGCSPEKILRLDSAWSTSAPRPSPQPCRAQCRIKNRRLREHENGAVDHEDGASRSARWSTRCRAPGSTLWGFHVRLSKHLTLKLREIPDSNKQRVIIGGVDYAEWPVLPLQVEEQCEI